MFISSVTNESLSIPIFFNKILAMQLFQTIIVHDSIHVALSGVQFRSIFLAL